MSPFDSGQAALDAWLRQRALRGQHSGGARTYMITTERRASGYFALALVIIPATGLTARPSVRTADPTERGLTVGSAVRTERLQPEL
ncbi:hypothetical protein THSYN_26130 [Candidatus Thiodictyon syntrophicum]|uniref:Uncharacterized protein n=1 Tax=Candidatus Thiodictyon syntrophicum TaxID=1166950 RepID=A0A2K8UG18_9GAMM|nr:hypothetical protein THSYN_26130 [Candidatus Thiodictyon syntrophicum]